MISLLRLKGRALQIDNILVMTLSLLTGAALLVTVNFLPAVYKAFVVPFIANNTALLSSVINFGFSLLFLLSAFGVLSSVRLGTKRYLFRKAVKKKPDSGDIFYYFRFRRFFSAFFYSLKTASVKIILFLFCFLPSVICLVTVVSFSRQGVSALVCLSLAVTAVCLFLNAGVFYSLFYSSFFLCDYYFVEGSCVSFRHLVSCSQKNMRKKNNLLTCLKLSFSGWFILCLLLLPIPYVWGYYNQCLAVAAAEFMKGKES